MPQFRRSLPEVAPDTYRAIRGIEAAVKDSGLDHSLTELIKLRASQINQCVFCIDMHTRDARRSGETERRLYLLSAWREAPFYTERERAALDWTEQLTRLAPDGALQASYNRLAGLFSETEVAQVTDLVGLINLWNRVAVGGGFHLAAA